MAIKVFGFNLIETPLEKSDRIRLKNLKRNKNSKQKQQLGETPYVK